jgi:hypothetical protein
MKTFQKIAVLALLLFAGTLARGQWSWQGTWLIGTPYTANQVVYYNGSSYLCLVGNTSIPPSSNPTDWALIAQAGAAGAAGTPASVSIGSTYAGPPLSYPAVVNTGSGSAAVLNFTIPQSWAVGQGVVTINGVAGAFTFNGSCFSQTGTTITFTCSGVSFTNLSSGTNITAAMLVGTGASLGTTGTGTISANLINGVPLCNGFSPTNGQNLQYTTASTPNPCYTAANGVGGYTSGNSGGAYWQKDPNGRITEWAQNVSLGGSDYAVVFPTAFTTSGSISIITNVVYASGDTGYTTLVSGSVSTTGFTVHQNNMTGMSMDWFAVGY